MIDYICRYDYLVFVYLFMIRVRGNIVEWMYLNYKNINRCRRNRRKDRKTRSRTMRNKSNSMKSFFPWSWKDWKI